MGTLRAEITHDLAGQPGGADRQLTPQNGNGVVGAVHGNKRLHHFVILRQGGVKPAQTGLLLRHAVAMIGQRSARHGDGERDRLRGQTGRLNRDVAGEGSGRSVIGNLHSTPQCLHPAGRHRHLLGERDARPVRPAGIEAAQRRGGNNPTIGRMQIIKADSQASDISHGIHTHLKRIKLSGCRRAGELGFRSGLYPTDGQMIGHADGPHPVLGKQQE